MRSGQRAVVIGGSIVGTLAARVLSEHYQDVVVIDRDPVLGVYSTRQGAPHAAHAHAVHSQGYENVMELFPDLPEKLAEHGIPTPDLGHMRWYFNARRLARADTGLTSIGAQRPVLEGILRDCVAELPNVTYLERTSVDSLTATRGRITEVTLTDSSGETRSLAADLVVDCSGRGSRLPAWLEQLGYDRPPEDRMTIRLAYTTRLFKHRPGVLDDTQSVNPVASPENPRGAFFGRVGPDVCILSLTGILGDRPPIDPDGFLEFARSLPVSEVYDAVKDCEPLTDAVSFGFPASVRRQYEALADFPENLVVLGDAACSFNPVYGQGVMVASIEVLALHRFLAGPDTSFAPFRDVVADIVAVPWMISTGGDLDFPGVPGERPPEVLAGNAQMARLVEAATQDPELTTAFLRVAGLKASPMSLSEPWVVARIEALAATTAVPSGALTARTTEPIG